MHPPRAHHLGHFGDCLVRFLFFSFLIVFQRFLQRVSPLTTESPQPEVHMTDARLPHSVPARHRWDSIHGGRGDAAMKVHAPAHRPQRPDEHEGITAPGKPLDAVAPDYTRLTADQAGAALT